jgi:hypothetical protein
MRLLKRLASVKTQRKEVIVEVAKLLAEIGSWRYVSSLNLTMSQGKNIKVSTRCVDTACCLFPVVDKFGTC